MVAETNYLDIDMFTFEALQTYESGAQSTCAGV